MAAREPSGSNTYIPSTDASGVIIAHTRDPKKFRINQWARNINVTKDQGYFLKLDLNEPVRLVTENDFVWEDGADAPAKNDGKADFEYAPYRTVRVMDGFAIGKKAVDQASWQILAQHANIKASKMMLLRTVKAAGLVTTEANWPAANVITADGAWATSSGADLYIQTAINDAMLQIEKNSNGVVTDEESLVMVINPVTARNIATSDEYRAYIQGSPDALAALTDWKNPNRKYGLAPYLYGLKLVVENSVRLNARKGNTSTSKDYVWPSTYAAIVSRPEGIANQDSLDGVDVSTVAFRFYEEMTVESKSDPDNRRELGRVVEDYEVQIQAPTTGCLIKSIV